jgi:hypothetical protein
LAGSKHSDQKAPLPVQHSIQEPLKRLLMRRLIHIAFNWHAQAPEGFSGRFMPQSILVL